MLSISCVKTTTKLIAILENVTLSSFSYNGLVSKVAIALPYSRAHGSRPFLSSKRAHFPHSSARDCARAVNLYAHV